MHRFAKIGKNCRRASACLVGAIALSACADEQIPPAVSAVTAVETTPSCGERGFLSATLFGSIERELAWRADELDCDNMMRPDGAGMRLRFTGNAADRAIAIILAMPDLERGQDGVELPAVVTLTVEGSGRFFSTADLDSCFSDIRVQPVDDADAQLYDADGTLYCVTPLGEINGDAALSIPKLEYRTRIEWQDNDS